MQSGLVGALLGFAFGSTKKGGCDLVATVANIPIYHKNLFGKPSQNLFGKPSQNLFGKPSQNLFGNHPNLFNIHHKNLFGKPFITGATIPEFQLELGRPLKIHVEKTGCWQWQNYQLASTDLWVCHITAVAELTNHVARHMRYGGIAQAHECLHRKRVWALALGKHDGLTWGPQQVWKCPCPWVAWIWRWTGMSKSTQELCDSIPDEDSMPPALAKLEFTKRNTEIYSSQDRQAHLCYARSLAKQAHSLSTLAC